MAIPRYVQGRKYWFQNCWEDLRSRHIAPSSLKQILLLGLLVSALGLVRLVSRLVKTSLNRDWLHTVMCYSLRTSDFGLLLTACQKNYPIISTYGSRIMRKRNRWVTEKMLKSGLFLTEVAHLVQSIDNGDKK